MYEYRLLSMHLNGTSAVGEWLLTRERPRIYEGNAIYFLKNMIFYFEILPWWNVLNTTQAV